MAEEKNKLASLKREIRELKKVNRLMMKRIQKEQGELFKETEERGEKKEICTTVEVPENLAPIFTRAQKYVSQYFNGKIEDPEHGTIEIKGERYLLVRAASMSKEFFETVSSHYQDRGEQEARRIATGLLFDFAHSVGKADAKSFQKKMKLTEPIEKLSAGPVHFAYTGWAFVKILPDSRPTPDQEYYLIYDHPFSFEADVWIQQGEKTDFPVCIMNCGYSSGWCQESFGLPLVAVEVECRAKGDDHCRFIMAPPDSIESHIARYHKKPYKGSPYGDSIEVPEFFKRKRLEDEIRKSEETTRALLNAPIEGALLLSTEGTVLALNSMAADRLGKDEADLIGVNIYELFDKKIRKKRIEYHRQAIETGEPVRYMDRRGPMWLDNRIYPIKDAEGRVMRVAIYSQDITEFKRYEHELRQHRDHLKDLVAEQTSELRQANDQLSLEIAEREKIQKALLEEKERLAITLTSIADGVVVIDPDGRITMLNQAATELIRSDENETIGRPFPEVFELSRQGLDLENKTQGDDLAKLIDNGELDKDFTLIDGWDHIHFIEVITSPITYKEGELIGYILVLRDITGAKQMEEELLKHRKIESLGILAGGIAHDFNNLLTGIIGNLSLVKLETDKRKKSYKQLEACERAAQDAKRLTQQLLTFSKGGDPVKKIVELTQLIRETVDFALSGSNVVAKYDIVEDVWPVEVDEGQFNQVINNLAINAVQAMPTGGTLEIRAENIEPGAGTDSLTPESPITSIHHVRISLTDEGSGISAPDMPKIFDPYFTTKTDGSGLGLATAYSIVKRHGGNIEVESKSGVGTMFTLRVPAKKPSNMISSDGQEKDPPKGSRRALLMDDERMILQVGTDMLKNLGFTVETAETGEKAVKLYEKALKRGNPHDILIFDLTIPGGMGGKEAIKVIKILNPEAKAVVSSGYYNDPILANYSDYGFSGVITKPYRLEDVKTVVDDILGPE